MGPISNLKAIYTLNFIQCLVKSNLDEVFIQPSTCKPYFHYSLQKTLGTLSKLKLEWKILHNTIIGNWHAIQLNNAFWFDGSDVKWNEGQGGTFTKDMCNGSSNQ
jgi:hypothetical protein